MHASKKNAQKMPIPVEVPMLCRISGYTVVEALVNLRCARTALPEYWPLARTHARRRTSQLANVLRTLEAIQKDFNASQSGC